MLTHRTQSARGPVLLAVAILTVSLLAFPLSPAEAQSGGPLLFPRVPQPDPPSEPEAAPKVLPDARFSMTRAWACRGNAELVRHHGPAEADLLLRLAAALQLAQPDRARLLEARASLREAARQAAQQPDAGEARGADLVLDLEERVDRVESELLNTWQSSGTSSVVCADALGFAAQALDLAEAMEAADGLAFVVHGSADELISDRLFELARSAPTEPRLPAGLERLVAARDELDSAQATWIESAATISALVNRYHRYRGYAAALYSETLHEIEQLVRRQNGPKSVLVADALVVATVRAREYAARNHPAFVAASESFLDTGGLPAGSERRLAAEGIIHLLRRQMPLLAELYLASEKRVAIAAASRDGSSLQPGAPDLDEALAHAWYRISRVAELLEQSGVSDLERGWAWTEIGRQRDRVLSLERVRITLENQRELRAASSSMLSVPERRQVVEREVQLINEIEAIKLQESTHFVALDRYGERLGRSAAQALEHLVRVADTERAKAGDLAVRRALVALQGQLAERLAGLRAGLEIGDELGEASGPLRSLAAGLELPFGTVADSLRNLTELEHTLEQADVAAAALRGLAGLHATAELDRAVLELTSALDLPLRPQIGRAELRLVLVGGDGSYTIRHSLPTSFVVPAAFVQGHDVGILSPAGFFLASTNEVPPWERPKTDPPEWDRSWGQRLAAIPENIGAEAWSNRGTYIGCVVLAVIPSEGITQKAAGKIALGTARRDVLFGTGKGLAEAFGDDPRTINSWKKALSWGRFSTDIYGFAKNMADFRNAAETAKKAEELLQAVGGGMSAGGETVDLEEPDEPYPYWENIRDATNWINQANEIAKTCQPHQWAEIRQLLDKAAEWEPNRQAEAWDTVGRWLMELAYTCPDKLAPFGGADPLEAALDALEEQIRACKPDTARAKLNQCRSPQYTALAQCLCRHDFDQDLGVAEITIGQLERGLGLLDSAEASCAPSDASSQAQQVLDWADEHGSFFECTEAMRARAQEIVQWAQQAESTDADAVLAEVETEIDACHLDAAHDLLGSVAAPTRCGDGTASGQVEGRRQELLARIATLKEHNERLATLQSDARSAFEQCDTERARSIQAELETLEPCAEDASVLGGDLRYFIDNGAVDDREVERIDAAASQALAECNGEQAAELVSELQGLTPCLEANRERLTELAERLRIFVEQGTDAEGDDQILAQAQEEFNSAVYGADRDCDLKVARQHMEKARELLLRLAVSPCRSPYLDNYDQLVMHGQFVEEKIDGREAVMQAIRGSAAAADAAFTSALQSCDAAGLDSAASQAAETIRIANGVPLMTGEGCQETNALVADATDLQAEAETLRSYWEGIDADLESARQAAAEGRTIAIDVYCAGVRQKAQPSRCFADALNECAGLSPAEVDPSASADTTPTGTTSAPPPTTSSSTAASGGEGSGRVQILGTEPCAADMSWVPSRQRFECTCPGYHLDPDLGRCVTGSASSVGISQADCDAQWPGTRLRQDPQTGQWACKCPQGVSAWSEVQGRCLSLTVGADGAEGRDCSHMKGTFFDESLGRCRCPVGTWQGGQCVDTAAIERDKQIKQATQDASCEKLYSEIQVFGSNTDPLQQQMAAKAVQEAYRRGCDAGRINQAVAAARMNPWSPGGGGGPAGGGGTGGGGGVGGGGGTGGGRGQARPTCRIIRYSSQGEAFLVYEQHAQGNHHNVYVVPIADDEEDGADVRAYWDSLGYQFIGYFRSYSAANAAAERVCQGKQMV